MSKIDLYLQLKTNLVKGRVIQSVYFTQYTTLQGEIRGVVTVTYLCDDVIHLEQDIPFTEQERDDILTQICLLQEVPCYPSAGNNCELGITKL